MNVYCLQELPSLKLRIYYYYYIILFKIYRFYYFVELICLRCS